MMKIKLSTELASTAMGFSVGILLIIAAAVFSMHVGYNQFGGYDLSPLIDISWRFFQGQTPGVDYLNTMPVILLVFLKLGNYSTIEWANLIVANVFATLLTFFYIFYATESRRSSLAWVFTTVTIISLPLIYTNHIWHSSLSQLIAICFFYSSYIFIESSRPSLKIQILLGLSAGLLFVSKQNLAPIPIIFPILILIYNFDNKWVFIRSSFVGIILILTASLLFLEMPLQEFLYSQSAILGRAKPDLGMFVAFAKMKSNYPLIGLTILMFFLAFKSIKNNATIDRKILILLLFFCAMSLLPIVTDWDAKLNNLPLPLFVFSIVILKYGSARAIGYMFISLFFIAVVAFFGGYSRERMMHVGDFYEKDNLHQISTGYFSGFNIGTRMYEVINEINSVKDAYPKSDIFFGPRIEFGYALTNSPSPKGFPLWWHPGTSYSLKTQDYIINNFTEKTFNILIFLKDDRTRVPSEILNFINLNYNKNQKYNFLDVYERNV